MNEYICTSTKYFTFIFIKHTANYIVDLHVYMITFMNMALILQDSWKYGRRVAEFKVVLDNLKSCVRCNLSHGPDPTSLSSH